MNPKLLVILKTIAVAAGTAALHQLAESWPSIQALIPPKYAGLGAAMGAVVVAYFLNPPHKDNP